MGNSICVKHSHRFDADHLERSNLEAAENDKSTIGPSQVQENFTLFDEKE